MSAGAEEGAMRHHYMKLKDGRFVYRKPPWAPMWQPKRVMVPFRWWSPADQSRRAYDAVAVPLHYWRVRRWAARQDAVS